MYCLLLPTPANCFPLLCTPVQCCPLLPLAAHVGIPGFPLVGCACSPPLPTAPPPTAVFLQKAFDDEVVLSLLSHSLQIEVQLELYLDFLWSDVPALRTAPEPLLRSICQILTRAYHVPGDIVMAKGDLAKYMHITQEGELAVYDSQGRYVRSICEGDVFGHEGLLAKGTGQKGQCQYTVVCEAHCETLVMDQHGTVVIASLCTLSLLQDQICWGWACVECVCGGGEGGMKSSAQSGEGTRSWSPGGMSQPGRMCVCVCVSF